MIYFIRKLEKSTILIDKTFYFPHLAKSLPRELSVKRFRELKNEKRMIYLNTVVLLNYVKHYKIHHEINYFI